MTFAYFPLVLMSYWLIDWTRLGCFYVTAILRWGYGWGWVKVDIKAEVEVRLSRSLVEFELSWSWDKLTLKGRNWDFIELGLWFKICFKFTHIAEQNMFSMSPSILAFNYI